MGQLLEKPVAARREMPIPSSLKNAIVTFEETTREWYVPVLSIVDKGLLKVKSLVLLKCIGSWKSVPIAVVGVLPDSTEFYNDFKIENTPHETFEEIGGLDMQIQELKEAVELPLTRPEYYEEMGIVAPKGVILYGPPGTGKTLLAKAVANNTSATFLRATGSELVKKSSGEGARRIRALFKLAEENAPSIIFIDEIDAIGSKRIETSSGGEKEVQRTMLELLNQLDGFDTIADVKVIMATNRVSSLDPALIRPGRIDRKIELPEPDEKAKLSIFTIYSKMMTLAEDVDFEKLVNKARPMTGGDIKGICTEAGMSALRAHRKSVTMHDFITGMDFVLSKQKNHIEESFYI